jgi:hypothetical protein
MQSDIDVKGFRSLLEGSEVEFVAERSAGGRLKATFVTGPAGSPAKVCSLAMYSGYSITRSPLSAHFSIELGRDREIAYRCNPVSH